MNLSRAILACGLVLAAPVCRPQPDFALRAVRVAPAKPDPTIAMALKTIEAARIELTIKTLVRFGTRSTLSSMETDLPPGQGINAAADWIAGQFEEISRQCRGCLEVHRDVFIANPASGAPWAARIPHPTRITNIYAILRGTDPVQSQRMYLVTGHYDSRNSNILDGRGAAPGANDDGSGVAVSLECARGHRCDLARVEGQRDLWCAFSGRRGTSQSGRGSLTAARHDIFPSQRLPC
jgi:hypothetical protein